MQIPKILVLNGSLTGAQGNTSKLIEQLPRFLDSKIEIKIIHLKDVSRARDIEEEVKGSDGYIFLTGTYWDSWGSPLQRFLEEATAWEATGVWLGKPAAVIVTMHAVGGKGVLSRLQGILNSLGLLLPPMSGIVLSLVGQMALEAQHRREFIDDLWCVEDLRIVLGNFQTALEVKPKWQPWIVDNKDPNRIWLDHQKEQPLELVVKEG